MSDDQDTFVFDLPFLPPIEVQRPDRPGPWNQPTTLPEHDAPAGYGEPRPPAGGSFAVEAQDLLNAANRWEEVSDGLERVWNLVQEGWGYPGIFGILDALQISGRLHMVFNESLVHAAADGAAITRGLARGLIETANDASGTDQTEGENFRLLENRATR